MAIQSLLYTAALTSHTQQLLEKRLQDLTKNFYDTAGIVRNSSVATTFSSIDNQLLTIGPKKSESLTSESQQPQQQSDQDIWNDDSKTATNPSTDNGMYNE
jgi:hypothetical protein